MKVVSYLHTNNSYKQLWFHNDMMIQNNLLPVFTGKIQVVAYVNSFTLEVFNVYI